MRNIYEMKQPESINELYEKARFILLYCYTSVHLPYPYGNIHNPHRYYSIKAWGNFVIMDTTVKSYNIDNRIEIPKYAPFNHS
jgi:hypothetical protein